jgi:hypothetical protein
MELRLKVRFRSDAKFEDLTVVADLLADLTTKTPFGYDEAHLLQLKQGLPLKELLTVLTFEGKMIKRPVFAFVQHLRACPAVEQAEWMAPTVQVS